MNSKCFSNHIRQAFSPMCEGPSRSQNMKGAPRALILRFGRQCPPRFLYIHMDIGQAGHHVAMVQAIQIAVGPIDPGLVTEAFESRYERRHVPAAAKHDDASIFFRAGREHFSMEAHKMSGVCDECSLLAAEKFWQPSFEGPSQAQYLRQQRASVGGNLYESGKSFHGGL